VEKTYVTKIGDVQRDWYVVDAAGQTLGRLATRVARVLRGKHKPIYSSSVDTGDYVIVVNAEKIHVTGRKLDQKIYYRHTGYPGGLKEITLRDLLQKHPTRVIEHAVRGMLPKNRLGRRMYGKLKVYAGPEHPHAAQQPKALELT
jgi:large subunit ribosomal protein L13